MTTNAMRRERRRPTLGDLPVREIAGEPSYAIAEAAKALGRSRPTLMRWVPHFRRFTGHAARQDGGRWFFPVAAVERLQHDPALLKELAKSSCTTEGPLSRCLRDVTVLKKEVSRLRADVVWLKKRAKKPA